MDMLADNQTTTISADKLVETLPMYQSVDTLTKCWSIYQPIYWLCVGRYNLTDMSTDMSTKGCTNYTRSCNISAISMWEAKFS